MSSRQTSQPRPARVPGRRAEKTSVVDRCAGLLMSLGGRRPSLGFTLGEAASATDLHKTTALRLLTAMQHKGVIDRGVDGRYRVGIRLIELVSGYLDDLDVVEQAYPTLEELSRETGETAHLGTLAGNAIVYVAKVESLQSLRMVSRVGSRNPLHCTALGKAILAWADEDLLASVAGAHLEARTEQTITDIDALRAELTRVRSRGYAIDGQENKIGICCVAAEVRDSRGRIVAAISISGPSVRMDETSLPSLGIAVRKAADRISRRLGHRSVDRGT